MHSRVAFLRSDEVHQQIEAWALINEYFTKMRSKRQKAFLVIHSGPSRHAGLFNFFGGILFFFWKVCSLPPNYPCNTPYVTFSINF